MSTIHSTAQSRKLSMCLGLCSPWCSSPRRPGSIEEHSIQARHRSGLNLLLLQLSNAATSTSTIGQPSSIHPAIHLSSPIQTAPWHTPVVTSLHRRTPMCQNGPWAQEEVRLLCCVIPTPLPTTSERERAEREPGEGVFVVCCWWCILVLLAGVAPHACF